MAVIEPVSVALATYNGERFLQEQLVSLAAQHLLPAELVISDDCSTDKTIEIAQSFAVTAPFPVRIERNGRNLGWRGNFMQAANLCHSPLVAFCDQDDVWYPDKLATVGALMDGPNVLLAYHDADLMDAQGRLYGRLREGESDCALLHPLSRPTTWSNPLGLTLIFRRSLLDFSAYWKRSVDTYERDMPAAHDQWIYNLAANLGDIRFIERRLLAYRQHGGNSVGFETSPQLGFLHRLAAAQPKPRYLAMMSAFHETLREAYASGTTAFSDQLPAAIEKNGHLLGFMDDRAALYAEDGFVSRLRRFVGLARRGAYSRTDGWTLGRRSSISDLVYGVLLAPARSDRIDER